MIKFVLLSLAAGLLAGCAATVTATDKAAPLALEALSGTSWAAVELATTSPNNSAAPILPRLHFIGLQQVGGNGGCNSFGGKAVVKGDSLRLGPLASTRKMCVGPAMDMELAFFHALERTRKARWVDKQLELQDDAGTKLLTLQRSD